MQIKIIFHKSTSKSYSSVCSICRNFDSFSCENNINTLLLTIEEFRNEYNLISQIINILSKWKKSECYLNDYPVAFKTLHIIYNVLLCEQECNNRCSKHCYSGVGWGCKFINRVELHTDSEWLSDPWYTYGYFEENTWIIEKDKIFEILQSEVESNFLTLCRYFSYDRLCDVLDEIPEAINITNDVDCKWQIEYRDAPLGMDKTKALSIKPRSVPNSFYLKKELQEYGFIKVSDDLEIELLSAFRECDWVDKMKIKIIAKRIAEGKLV